MSEGRQARKARKAFIRAFGAESRARMLEDYFRPISQVTPQDAWLHVYRLLLWIDPTTALVHCYESDKAQPGRTWYARSLAFHVWLSQQVGVPADQLGDHIDWLFRKGTALLAAAMAKQMERRASKAETQLIPYRGRGVPVPGQDPAVEAVIREELQGWLTPSPPNEALHRLARRLRSILSQENKRKNLIGEGFEDVLAYVIKRMPGADNLDIRSRTPLSQLWGFRPPASGQKEKKVDLAIRWPNDRRLLVTAKWSVRADREEQLTSDFEAYARLDAWGRDFEYVLITNEFDAARLAAACDNRRQNAALFSVVVHVNPEGPMVAYGTELRAAAARLPDHLTGGRLVSLESWLTQLLA